MSTAARGPRGSIAGIHVLLVADDRARVELIRAFLEYAGALVTVRRSYRSASRAMRQVRPNALVIHVDADDEDAIRFIQTLRPSPSGAGGASPSGAGGAIPTIALVASCPRSDAERLRAGGFHVCLTAPVRVSELARAVGRLVRRNR
jgi:CheY-like chemotaxis protein